MSNNNNYKPKNEVMIKFLSPVALKNDLQKLASERNISLSSLIRLIATDYVKRNKSS